MSDEQFIFGNESACCECGKGPCHKCDTCPFWTCDKCECVCYTIGRESMMAAESFMASTERQAT